MLFWDLLPDGTIDPHSLHGGCPVKQGTKWVATKWMRNSVVLEDRSRVKERAAAEAEAAAAAKGL